MCVYTPPVSITAHTPGPRSCAQALEVAHLGKKAWPEGRSVPPGHSTPSTSVCPSLMLLLPLTVFTSWASHTLFRSAVSRFCPASVFPVKLRVLGRGTGTTSLLSKDPAPQGALTAP